MITKRPAVCPTLSLLRVTSCFLLLAPVVFSATGCDTPPAGLNGQPGGMSMAGPEAPAAPMLLEDTGAGDSGAVLRDIEEADVVKIVGDRLYAINRYKGLLVIDVADPDAPTLLGNLDLRGRGVEMYVVGDRVYVLLSADFFIAYDVGVGQAAAMSAVPDGPMPPRPDFEGSQLAIADVTDPTAPSSEGKINLVGFANESRRVGDIIYVIGSNFRPYFADDPENDEAAAGEGFVASINVADPNNVLAVDRLNLTGDALDMHVSETAIFAASRQYDFDNSETLTDIQIVDISDAAGAIQLRDMFTVPGSIRNRFYMDAFEGVFRIATESFGFGFREVRLFTYDLADLDAVAALGQTDIIRDESLEAVRFDGPRGYVVTFLSVDPLFVLDLSDPAYPTVAGQLEVPGFSTHIEPRGDRLIAVGIDDTDGTRPVVAYYDVADPAHPSQLGRVILGPPGSFTSSEATYDEKAFKIVDALGLIAIPFRHVEYSDVIAMPGGAAAEILPDNWEPPKCTNGVQLVDFNDAALTQRGYFEHEGEVQRVGVIGDRVFALSQRRLQTVDITDRDNPSKAGDAALLGPDELAMWDDCGGFDIPPMPMPGVQIDVLDLLNSCGVVSALPGAMLTACLFVALRRRRARQ